MDNQFKCNECSFSTSSSRGLKRHASIKHKKQDKSNWLECSRCHHKYKTLNDGICGNCDFAINGRLKECKQCHKQKLFYSNRSKICKDCKKENELAYQKHIEAESSKTFRCDVCNKECASERALKRHKTMLHSDLKKDDSLPECSNCHKHYAKLNEQNLCGHCNLNINGKDAICQQCHKSVKFYSNKQKICSDCLKKNKKQKQIDKAKRNDPSNLICPVCGRQLDNLTGYKIHVGTHEDGYQKRVFSEEARKKMSDASIGKVMSEEAKEKARLTKCINAVGEELASILLDKDKLKNEIEEVSKELNRKPTFFDMNNHFNCWSYAVYHAIIKARLDDLIERNSSHSYEELQVLDYVKSLGFEDAHSTRQVIKPKELDIYVESKKLAIEFDGSYWHSDATGTDSSYHLDKTIACEKQGIRLIHIFEWEWMNKQDIIKSMIRTALGLSKKVYARKCSLIDVDSRTAARFLEANHIQGAIGSSMRLGLEYDGQLVALMTFGKSRFKKFDGVEMLRYCCKRDIEVVGGMSKLLKRSVEKFCIHDVLSYCNRSKFTGKSYEKLGFKHVRDTIPSYWWISELDMKTRYQTQMKNENEIMRSKGYAKTYDCGNKVYELHL